MAILVLARSRARSTLDDDEESDTDEVLTVLRAASTLDDDIERLTLEV